MSTLPPTISPRPSRGHRALTLRGSGVDVAELAEANGDAALVGADDGGRDVLEALEARVAAEDDLLAGGLDVAAAADAVVALESPRSPSRSRRRARRGARDRA